MTLKQKPWTRRYLLETRRGLSAQFTIPWGFLCKENLGWN